MKKYLVILFISALSSAQSNKQNIRGIVIDKLTQTPIIGATVQINNSENKAITDEKGNYILTDIAPDRYDINVSFVGYQKMRVKCVADSILNIYLKPGQEIDEVMVFAQQQQKFLNQPICHFQDQM